MAEGLAAKLRTEKIKTNARTLAECIHKGLLNPKSRQHYDVETIAEMIEAQVAAALDSAPSGAAQREAEPIVTATGGAGQGAAAPTWHPADLPCCTCGGKRDLPGSAWCKSCFLPGRKQIAPDPAGEQRRCPQCGSAICEGTHMVRSKPMGLVDLHGRPADMQPKATAKPAGISGQWTLGYYDEVPSEPAPAEEAPCERCGGTGLIAVAEHDGGAGPAPCPECHPVEAAAEEEPSGEFDCGCDEECSDSCACGCHSVVAAPAPEISEELRLLREERDRFKRMAGLVSTEFDGAIAATLEEIAQAGGIGPRGHRLHGTQALRRLVLSQLDALRAGRGEGEKNG